MKTKHVIRVRKTKEEIYCGSTLEDCKKLMKHSFFKHIQEGNPMENFALEAVTVHEFEEDELPMEDEEYNDFHESE